MIYILSFIAVVSIVVFIHELGHYLVAKWCGVRVDEFSIGFGKTLLSFKDRSGTEWKVCLLPFGGYVKMYGDTNAASFDTKSVPLVSEYDMVYSFRYQNVWKRFAIIFAGPLFNFIFPLIVYTALYSTIGVQKIPPVVAGFTKNSAAQEAGFKIGDRVISINNKEVRDFSDIGKAVFISMGEPIKFTLLTHQMSRVVELMVKPKLVTKTNRFGEVGQYRSIGISSVSMNQVSPKRQDIFTACKSAASEIYQTTSMSIQSIWQMINGKRSLSDISGPLKIAKYSGEASKSGILSLIQFMTLISISLGVINLFPIPLLDGGHLVFYVFEIILGRALPSIIHKIAYFLGIGVIGIMVIGSLFNDTISIVRSKMLSKKTATVVQQSD